MNVVTCLYKANAMNEANLARQALRVLAARLPPGWKQKSIRSKDRRQPDALVEITGPDGVKVRIAVEAKTKLFPRDVAKLKTQLQSAVMRQTARSPRLIVNLVVAEFLSPSTRQQLRNANLNYLDLTGNLRLVVSRPGLYLETSGASEDPSPPVAMKRSLRGPKAGRLVRALCDFPLPLTISELATKAGVDVSYASRLVEWLAREALLTRVPRGAVQEVRRAQLIRRWADDYSVLKSNEARSFLDPRGLGNLVRGLGQSRFRYVATGSLAANRIAPIAPARLALVYVDDPDQAAAALRLRPTDAGANVMLLSPFDSVVFERVRKDDTLTIVAPSQAAVDLLTSPGRAPAEAEAILEWMEQNAPREEADGL